MQDILRIDLNGKHLDCCDYNVDQLRACMCQACYEETDQMGRRQRSRLKNQRMISPRTTCSPKRKKFSTNFICKKELKSMRESPYIVRPSTCFSRQK